MAGRCAAVAERWPATRVLTLWIGVLLLSLGLLLYARPALVLTSYHHFVPYALAAPPAGTTTTADGALPLRVAPISGSGTVPTGGSLSSLAQIDALTLVHVFAGVFGSTRLRRRTLQLLTAPYLALVAYRLAHEYSALPPDTVTGSAWHALRGLFASKPRPSHTPAQLLYLLGAVALHLVLIAVALYHDLATAKRAAAREGLPAGQEVQSPAAAAAAARAKEREKAAKDAAQRAKVRAELISTEVTYVRLLSTLSDHYLQPLLRAPHTYDVTSAEVQQMFANTESILHLHRIVLSDLQARADVAVSGVLLKHADFLRLYVSYVTPYSSEKNGALTTIAAQRRNEKLQTFFAAQKQLCGHDLMSLLILPVQRVPRYVLLLTELIRFTPASHPEYESAHSALAKVQAIALQLNESKRSAEQLTVLVKVQNRLTAANPTPKPGQSAMPPLFEPHRRLVREGSLQLQIDGLFSARNTKACELFLFCDLLLWTNAELKYKGHIPLPRCRVSACTSDDHHKAQAQGSVRHGFTLTYMEHAPPTGAAAAAAAHSKLERLAELQAAADAKAAPAAAAAGAGAGTPSAESVAATAAAVRAAGAVAAAQLGVAPQPHAHAHDGHRGSVSAPPTAAADALAFADAKPGTSVTLYAQSQSEAQAWVQDIRDAIAAHRAITPAGSPIRGVRSLPAAVATKHAAGAHSH